MTAPAMMPKFPKPDLGLLVFSSKTKVPKVVSEELIMVVVGVVVVVVVMVVVVDVVVAVVVVVVVVGVVLAIVVVVDTLKVEPIYIRYFLKNRSHFFKQFVFYLLVK